MRYFIALIVGLCAFTVQTTYTGMAFSVDAQTIDSSKKATIAMIHRTLSEIDFEEMSFKDKYFIDTMKVNDIVINEENINLRIEGDKLVYEANNFQCQLEGHMSHKNWRGKRNDGTDFYMRLAPGSISFRLEFIMDHQFVDYQTLPLLQLDSTRFDLDYNQVDIDLVSSSTIMKIYAEFVKTFKRPIVFSTQVALNYGFKTIFNKKLAAIQSDYEKIFSTYMIKTIFNIIPVHDQEITIPQETFVSYAMCDERRATIGNNKIEGYFTGKVKNVENTHIIQDQKYMQLGDLNLEDNGRPFQYQVSLRVINEIYELIMGYNQLEMRVPYEYFRKSDFPIPFTTTQIDGAVPGLADYVGYDLPLSVVFKNLGAPRFVFNDEEMSILFSMEVDYYVEDFSEKLMTITYNDIYIDFDMWLEDMMLKFEWWSIKMDSAHVVSDVIENLELSNADQHVEDYFNWAFDFILAWVNDNEIENVSYFVMPEEIPGIMKISDLQMSVEENYFKFSSAVEFTIEDIGSQQAQDTFHSVHSVQSHESSMPLIFQFYSLFEQFMSMVQKSFLNGLSKLI